MLHEGISEAGCVASATAAGSSYSTHGEPMIPFYIFYSMFGFQRTGDSIWAMADQLARGFLIGATAGRTTLTGEGLQHADGHSPLIALTNPAVVHYDPAFSYEIAPHRRTTASTGCTAPPTSTPTARTSSTTSPSTTSRPSSPPSPRTSTSRASSAASTTWPRRPGPAGDAPRVQLLASGVGLPLDPQGPALLATDWGVAADTWSVTSWNELSREALATEEWNLLNPTEKPAVPFVTRSFGSAPGPVVAVSDYMKAVQQQISPWVPQRFHALGADGFGFADTRAAARRFFKIDAESVVVQALAGPRRGGRDRPRHRPEGPRPPTASPTPPPSAGVKQEAEPA